MWTLFELILLSTDGAKHTLRNTFIRDYCLPLEMNTFGPKNV